MPKEKSIVASIVRVAEANGWKPIKIHGGPYQLAGLPDLLCLKNGHAVWLEVKQPGKRPTAIQVRRMNELETKGGTACHVVTSKQEAEERLLAHEVGHGWQAATRLPAKSRRRAR